MEIEQTLKFLDNLEKGMFCIVEFPLTNDISFTTTAMYVGRNEKGLYNFFDNRGGSGIIGVSRKFIEQGKVKIKQEVNPEKTFELYTAFKLKEDKERRKNKEVR